MSSDNRFLLYTAPSGAVRVDVFLKDETLWLTQKALAELFGVKVPAINKHLKNIFDSGELMEPSVISILEPTAGDRKTYSAKYYNLDAILGHPGKVSQEAQHNCGRSPGAEILAILYRLATILRSTP